MPNWWPPDWWPWTAANRRAAAPAAPTHPPEPAGRHLPVLQRTVDDIEDTTRCAAFTAMLTTSQNPAMTGPLDLLSVGHPERLPVLDGVGNAAASPPEPPTVSPPVPQRRVWSPSPAVVQRALRTPPPPVQRAAEVVATPRQLRPAAGAENAVREAVSLIAAPQPSVDRPVAAVTVDDPPATPGGQVDNPEMESSSGVTLSRLSDEAEPPRLGDSSAAPVQRVQPDSTVWAPRRLPARQRAVDDAPVARLITASSRPLPVVAQRAHPADPGGAADPGDPGEPVSTQRPTDDPAPEGYGDPPVKLPSEQLALPPSVQPAEAHSYPGSDPAAPDVPPVHSAVPAMRAPVPADSPIDPSRSPGAGPPIGIQRFAAVEPVQPHPPGHRSPSPSRIPAPPRIPDLPEIPAPPEIPDPPRRTPTGRPPRVGAAVPADPPPVAHPTPAVQRATHTAAPPAPRPPSQQRWGSEPGPQPAAELLNGTPWPAPSAVQRTPAGSLPLRTPPTAPVPPAEHRQTPAPVVQRAAAAGRLVLLAPIGSASGEHRGPPIAPVDTAPAPTATDAVLFESHRPMSLQRMFEHPVSQPRALPPSPAGDFGDPPAGATTAEPADPDAGDTAAQLPAIQRDVGTEPAPSESPATESTEPSAAPAQPVGAPPVVGAAPTGDIEELVNRLYDPLAARLRAELWLDRERAGALMELG